MMDEPDELETRVLALTGAPLGCAFLQGLGWMGPSAAKATQPVASFYVLIYAVSQVTVWQDEYAEAMPRLLAEGRVCGPSPAPSSPRQPPPGGSRRSPAGISCGSGGARARHCPGRSRPTGPRPRMNGTARFRAGVSSPRPALAALAPTPSAPAGARAISARWIFLSRATASAPRPRRGSTRWTGRPPGAGSASPTPARGGRPQGRPPRSRLRRGGAGLGRGPRLVRRLLAAEQVRLDGPEGPTEFQEGDCEQTVWLRWVFDEVERLPDLAAPPLPPLR